MSRRASAHAPFQKPAKSAVTAIGRRRGTIAPVAGRNAAGQQRCRRHAIERLRPGRGQGRRLGIVDRGASGRKRPDGRAGRGRRRRRSRASGRVRMPSGRFSRRPAGGWCRPDTVSANPECWLSRPHRRQSGQPASGSIPRIRATRAWSWRAASVQGSGRRSCAATALAERFGDLRRVAWFGAVRQDQAPRRRRRRASTVPATGSNPASTCSVTRAASEGGKA